MKRRSIRIENSPAPGARRSVPALKLVIIAETQNRPTQNIKTQHRPQPGLNRDTAAQITALATSDVERLYGREPPGRPAKKKMPPHPPRRVLPASGKLEIRRFGGLLVSRGCNNPHLCLVVDHPKRDHILWQRGIGNKISCAKQVGNWGKPRGLSQVVNRECTGGRWTGYGDRRRALPACGFLPARLPGERLGRSPGMAMRFMERLWGNFAQDSTLN